MPITRNFFDAIIRQQKQSAQQLRTQQRGRTVLGGSSGSAGGSGGPPGGFVGKLTQRNVCYDTTEAESLTGTTSLVDNLNHIRQRITAASSLYYLSQVFTDTDNISVTHSFGKYPTVVALAEKTYGWGSFWGDMPWGGVATGYWDNAWGSIPWGGAVAGCEVLTPSSIDHMNTNQVIVTLSSSKTGYIICIA